MSRVTAVKRSRKALPLFALALAAAAVAASAAAPPSRSSGHAAAGPFAKWQTLPRAPIAGRVAESVVWTGRELIVAGGLTRHGDGTNTRASDAAAYSPATGQWRRLASPPSGVGAGAVWTGGLMVAWTGNGPDGPAVAALFNPVTNRWRHVPAGPLGSREGNANVWTGKVLLVVGGYSGDALATPVAAALDPTAATWRRLTRLDGLTFAGGLNGAVWDGREAIIAGNLSLCPQRGSACDRSRPIVVAYDPARDRMRELKLPRYSAAFGADTAVSLTPVAWTGRAVVFRAWTPGSLRVLTYWPASGRWWIGPRAPRSLSHGTDTQTVWIGDRLVAPAATGGLQIYAPKTGSWQWLPTSPSASLLSTRTGSATAWTGRTLVVWSGVAFERFNPTPADGALLVLGK